MLLCGQKNLGCPEKIDEFINKAPEPSFKLSSLLLTPDKLETGQILCATVNGKWIVRARPVSSSLDNDGLLEIYCMEIGIQQLVPLSFLRVLPADEDFLRSTPLLASKYILADVVVDDGIKAKD